MTSYAQGILNGPEGLFLALLVGLGFGFWLERAGFGSSRKLAAIFYFRDFAVLKVMGTAIVTAALGLWTLNAGGLVAMDGIFQPETFLWPQLVGGLLFGVGFVMGGWCPGTALVGLASGKLDALVFLAAVGGGSLAFAFVEPGIRGFSTSGAWGVSTLPDILGMSSGQVTLLVLVAALLAFAAATRVERSMAARLAARQATPTDGKE